MDNKNLVWEEQHLIHTSEADFRSHCRPAVLLDMLQRTADSAVNALGISWQEMLDNGMGWMLMTLDLGIQQMPRFGETVTVRTWNKGTKGPLWQRDYRLFNEEGKERVSAKSTWTLVDIHKRKILRPSALPIAIEPYTQDSVGSIPDKVVLPPELLLFDTFTYEVRYSGLDINGHLNNARYADLCYDALLHTELNGLTLRRFVITYLKEAKLGDMLQILRTDLEEDKIYFRGQVEGEVCFEACLYFRQNEMDKE